MYSIEELAAMLNTKNVWGTEKSEVGDGFCRDCEREQPHHYNNCPQHINAGDFAVAGGAK